MILPLLICSWFVSCDANMTRNSSGDEIANVNFLYDDIVHVLQNTIDSYICINSATDRRGYVLERIIIIIIIHEFHRDASLETKLQGRYVSRITLQL